MVYFFKNTENKYFAVSHSASFTENDIPKLKWLFGEAVFLGTETIEGDFIGPRASMITPWSTNAVEITQNMVIEGILRIEQFSLFLDLQVSFDPMLLQRYHKLDQQIFDFPVSPEPIKEIKDISAYNQTEGLSLSEEEIQYLEDLAIKLGRKLTDSEVFGFSQVNSEHCRHKIFNGTFVIDNEEMDLSLFKWIKKTSQIHPNQIVSAYKDNVAFVQGPDIIQFAPASGDKADFYQRKKISSVLSLKAETHNFPTTVEPFNGAATGSGGEIRDRLAGGQGSIPLAGTAVYMTPYARRGENVLPETEFTSRKWLYQTPLDILIKASNGASDFGNKFGQPLIAGSLLTFEHEENGRYLGYDKVIMLAGGIGFGNAEQSKKLTPEAGDKIVVLGGDNYRIGMGGAAVSSADTGSFSSGIELNAVQRSNPEMQKRVANAIRTLTEEDENPIISIHDHGAGGHLNCLSELVEETGGVIEIDNLPIGDPTLSDKEIIGNESQERMGLIIKNKDILKLKAIAERERAPMYLVGEVTSDHRFTFRSSATGLKPMDLKLSDIFGSSPKFVMKDQRISQNYATLEFNHNNIYESVKAVLQLEAVACKDWLTNKVDRCVSGRVAKQQCAGPLQLPLNNCGVMALDFEGNEGIATSIGHAPVSALIDAAAGSRNAIAEALTNIVWAPLNGGIKGISLSANWMWPCKNPGEDARLYDAVQACAEFAIALGINIPTGKDSLSMKQKYPDREVIAPGTVIISAAAHCTDIKKVVEPVMKKEGGAVYYINVSGHDFELGGSSFAQSLHKVGNITPDINNPEDVVAIFNTVQNLIHRDLILAGHDVGSGGLITTLLEMLFADNQLSASFDLSELGENDIFKLLFSENAGIVFQIKAGFETEVEKWLDSRNVKWNKIGEVHSGDEMQIRINENHLYFNVSEYRDIWYKTSYRMDIHQSGEVKALERFNNYKNQPLKFVFPKEFNGKKPVINSDLPRIKAAVIREKGSNSERELANAMFLAGFDVKDVHMTDLVSGRETLEDIHFIGAVGGFSNSDVLGSAKGWAGAFMYNEKAKAALDKFFARKDTLSVGICNGCQLFVELGLIDTKGDQKPIMTFNESNKHESAFTSVTIQKNNSVMLSSLEGCTLGVWISHGEGKFLLKGAESEYHIVAKYGYNAYPANPNGSDYNTAMMSTADGRHLVMMPHIERSTFQWNWANYEEGRQDEVSPWLEAFINARKWLEERD
ncbi:MAG: phosphoribosylformylglycinamidine synthase [Saprospiraceae bacterium]|nr:phosphoribosylformylglycinamidine synthase [Saprospiraceae bacterium]